MGSSSNTSNERTVCDTAMVKSFYRELAALKEAQQFCDLTVKVGDQEFKVHKVVLVASSIYFQKMFAEKRFKESGKGSVELKDIESHAFKTILEYFYSGSITLRDETIASIIKLADFLSLDSLKMICCIYLLESIDVNRCIPIYILGATFKEESVKSSAKKYFQDNLEEVYETEEFVELNQEILSDLLTFEPESGNDKWHSIYNGVMKWVKHDLKNREGVLHQLLKLVPTEEMTVDFYTHIVKKERLLRDSIECTNWLLDRCADKLTKAHYGQSDFRGNLFIASQSNFISCFQLTTYNDKLIPLPHRPNIDYFAAVSYNDSIWLTAGQYENRNINKSYTLKGGEGSWSEIDLSFDRCRTGACVSGDKLFIVGGTNANTFSPVGECTCYDFTTGQKYSFTELNSGRCFPGVVSYHNAIYTCCGEGQSTDFNKIERYDPREGVWKQVGTFYLARGRCSSAVVSNYLYTCDWPRGDVDRFDFRNCKTEGINSILSRSVWLSTSNNRLFGVAERGLFEYNSKRNTWIRQSVTFDVPHPIVTSWS